MLGGLFYFSCFMDTYLPIKIWFNLSLRAEKELYRRCPIKKVSFIVGKHLA